jgi:hypothetical protein
MDPRIAKVIRQCLEIDPSLRPKSAQAVADGLPKGDPLATALAEGRTPSPENVANAGDEGSLTPRVATALLAAVVLVTAGMMERDGLVVWLGHTMTLVSWAVIFLAWLFGAEGIQKLWKMLF